jgi:aldehyde:ferredoxin oxidoreductase
VDQFCFGGSDLQTSWMYFWMALFAHALADLGGPQVLKATRRGQTGCHWCQVDCRHYHWIKVDYAPAGRDMLLDDFEPTYATFAMLGLEPTEDTFQARLDLRDEVDRRLLLPIEQMGCDTMNVGLGLAALFEGIERGLIPATDFPPALVGRAGAGRLEAAVQGVAMLCSGQAFEYPALRAVDLSDALLPFLRPLRRTTIQDRRDTSPTRL